MKKWFAWILVLAMLAVSMTACGEKAVKLDLSDYANALFRGPDGEGTARGDFDYTGFEHAILEGAVETGFNLSTIMKFESAVTVTVSPESGLRNGDRVTVTVTYDKDAAKEAGLRIAGDKKTVTVEGLGGASGSAGSADAESALIELDAFDPASWNTPGGITLSYEGVSPYGYLEVKNGLPADNPLSGVGYRLSETQKVHEGDTVTVTPYFTKADMKKQYRFREESGTYTVGAVDHYLTQVSELDAGTIASLKRSAEQPLCRRRVCRPVAALHEVQQLCLPHVTAWLDSHRERTRKIVNGINGIQDIRKRPWRKSIVTLSPVFACTLRICHCRFLCFCPCLPSTHTHSDYGGSIPFQDAYLLGTDAH